MGSFLLIIFITLVKLKLTVCADTGMRNINAYYGEYTYKVHPLLVILEGNNKRLLLQNNLNKHGMPKLKLYQQLQLTCCGYSNRIATTKEDQHRNDSQSNFWNESIKFPQGNFFRFEYEKAFCFSPLLVTYNERFPEKRCGLNDKGKIWDIGFQVDNKFLKLYTICFDENLLSVIYTTHILLGSNLLFPENRELWGAPKKYLGRLYKMTSVPSAYYPDIQEKIFRRGFGEKQAQIYLNIRDANGTLYTAAPLTPPGDFYFPPHKTATGVYENTLPVFNKIFTNDWHIVGELGRLLALQVNSKKLFVVSGGYLDLILPDGSDRFKGINLDADIKNNKRYRPVSRFIYKIYLDADSKKGIAFVTMNNPYYTFTEADFPCRHIGVDFIHIDYFSIDGIHRNTVYCEVNDLLEKVKGTPTLDVSNGILFLDIYDRTHLPEYYQLPTNYRVIKHNIQIQIQSKQKEKEPLNISKQASNYKSRQTSHIQSKQKEKEPLNISKQASNYKSRQTSQIQSKQKEKEPLNISKQDSNYKLQPTYSSEPNFKWVAKKKGHQRH